MNISFKKWLFNEIEGGLIKPTGIGSNSAMSAVKVAPIKPMASAKTNPEDALISSIKDAATLYQDKLKNSGVKVNDLAKKDPEGTFDTLAKYDKSMSLLKNKPAVMAAIKGLISGDQRK